MPYQCDLHALVSTSMTSSFFPIIYIMPWTMHVACFPYYVSLASYPYAVVDRMYALADVPRLQFSRSPRLAVLSLPEQVRKPSVCCPSSKGLFSN
jgi:hypothetical protein